MRREIERVVFFISLFFLFLYLQKLCTSHFFSPFQYLRVSNRNNEKRHEINLQKCYVRKKKKKQTKKRKTSSSHSTQLGASQSLALALGSSTARAA